MLAKILLALLIAIPCLSQTPTTQTAKTRRPCSLVGTGGNNTVTFSCQGISKELGDRVLRIMNAMLEAERSRNKDIQSQRIVDQLSDILAYEEANRRRLHLLCKSWPGSSPELQKECEQVGVHFTRELTTGSETKDKFNEPTPPPTTSPPK